MRSSPKPHLKLGGDHGAFLGEALAFLNPRLAVSDAQNLHDRALLLARVAMAHRVVPRREDGSLLKSIKHVVKKNGKRTSGLAEQDHTHIGQNIPQFQMRICMTISMKI